MTDLGFLMWNIRRRGNACSGALHAMLEHHRPDILLLVESDLEDQLIEQISGDRLRSVMISAEKSIRLYVRRTLSAQETHKEEIAEDGRFRQIKERLIFFRLEMDGRRLLLVAVHFPSKWNHSPTKQFNIMKRWRGWIEAQEMLLQTENTLIFGDLNLNPFDQALVQVDGLHAHPSLKSVASPPARYYNPMWSTLGDFVYGTDTAKVPGTFWWEPDTEDDQQHHWNSIDGVLINRALEPNFVKRELEIVTECGGHILATTDKISPKYSDHLPVRFKLRFS